MAAINTVYLLMRMNNNKLKKLFLKKIIKINFFFAFTIWEAYLVS